MSETDETLFLTSSTEVYKNLHDFIEHADVHSIRQRVLTVATQLAKEHVRQKYSRETGPDHNQDSGSNWRAYHNIEHIEDNERRGLKILKALGSSEEDETFFKFLNAMHDYDIDKGRGESELFCAQQVINFLNGINNISVKFGKEIFKPEEIASAGLAIEITTPQFNHYPGSLEGGLTATQQKLPQASSLAAVALALADIGTAGLEPEKILKDGANLFFEYNPEWQNFEKDMLLNKAKLWFGNQAHFVEGRAALTKAEINSITFLNNQHKIALMQLFTDQNFSFAKSLVKRKQRIIYSLGERTTQNQIINILKADTPDSLINFETQSSN